MMMAAIVKVASMHWLAQLLVLMVVISSNSEIDKSTVFNAGAEQKQKSSTG